MPVIGYLLILLIVFACLLNTDQARQEQMLRQAEINAVAGNLMVYRNVVSAFSEANPAFVGTATDAVLGLPTWYRRQPGMGNYLSNGKSYVFYTLPLPGLVGSLADRSHSISVGTNSGGVLVTPVAGNTGIPVPAQIPATAVVIIQ